MLGQDQALSDVVVVVVGTKSPDQTHWYCPGTEQREERGREGTTALRI